MTDFREFFRILCRHRAGYGSSLDYASAVQHPGQDTTLPRSFFMVPLPTGEADTRDRLASEWIATEGTA